MCLQMSPSWQQQLHVVCKWYDDALRVLQQNEWRSFSTYTSNSSWSLCRWIICGVKLKGFPSPPSLRLSPSVFPVELSSSQLFISSWPSVKRLLASGWSIVGMSCHTSFFLKPSLCREYSVLVVGVVEWWRHQDEAMPPSIGRKRNRLITRGS